ncbi:GNAT family N-acetyltransferase [Shewanella pneumatophori]|uniref:GNAT family N-acetyltransferase n=1 Tax=Shewanella pneumatophori TaxID=314092 RepID=A0A9X2CC19_9GAMM|nr:GNAT family N-acetyltransferase [Shewanella pneumatophori]MCL1137508.1 GNAT family N-acetyltransferase [Shewanella pneumatophori]
MIELSTAKDLAGAAELTLTNMQPYYKKYRLDWDSTTILTMTKDLNNLQISLDGEVVGILRLSVAANVCQLRDLQIDSHFQNRGIGKQVLMEVVRIAEHASLKCIELKVFQLSPAVRLYQRFGFSVQQQDERFFYMQFELGKVVS